jgi:hypothetical protein
MSNTRNIDAIVTADDFLHLKAEIDRGEFKRLVDELVAREPELTIALSERYDLIATMLESAPLSIRNRAMMSKHLCLAVWAPLLLLDRAHRRNWNDFLPSDDITHLPPPKTTDRDGGVA